MASDPRIVVVSGTAGLIVRNLVARLQEQGPAPAVITGGTPTAEARAAVASADVVFHLGGDGPDAGDRWIVEAIAAGGRRPLVICRCSPGAFDAALSDLADRGAVTASAWRLPEVFGKWAAPEDTSSVAALCRDLAQGRRIRIDDAARPLDLLYVDDLIDQWIGLIGAAPRTSGVFVADGMYHTSVGEVAAAISAFAEGRSSGQVGDVGQGLERALYATFVASLPKDAFSYPLTSHTDARGGFTEVLKASGGQVSFFTAHSGVTRGGHYHHSKVEKFVVVQGEARFRFRHILTGERHEVRASSADPAVVETIPGWAHDVTNLGAEDMVCLLWASEVFDRDRPDTVAAPL